MEFDPTHLKIGGTSIGEVCFPHRLPKEPYQLNQRIHHQPAEDPIEARSAPGPELGRMKDKRESNMPSETEAKCKHDPFSHQRHMRRLSRAWARGRGYTEVLADSISVAVMRLER